MNRKPRIHSSHRHYHVTVYCNPSSNRVLAEEDFFIYLNLLGRVKQKHQFTLFHYGLLPDRVHLFLKPSSRIDLSKTMHLINWSFAKSFNRRRNLRGHFWLERYRSLAVNRGDESLETMREIDRGPVRNGLVKDPAEWAWSGYSALTRGTSDELLTFHPDYLDLGITAAERQEEYRRWVREKMS